MTDRDDDLGAELRQETIRLAEGVVALRQRIAELERERDIEMTQRGGFQLALQDHAVKLERTLAAARELKAALIEAKGVVGWFAMRRERPEHEPYLMMERRIEAVVASTAWLDAPENP